ncbi:BnaA05g34390D [Brassica napus]|uniref:BnaA05g34390D protein n=1 Tax=Brassica napus TaxID=3708 RepID=A0A078IYR6_BRANA|nr:BnaA05g34390D [Brassica napus]
MLGDQSSELSENNGESESPTLRLCANGACMKTTEVEAKLDEGNIQDAESSLREGLSLNSEEARALLGRLEYQRGNVEGALRVFEGIDLQAAIQRLQVSAPPPEKPSTKKKVPREQPQQSASQHAANLVLEAIYLKAKSLQKLGRTTEAAQECKSVLDSVEKIFQQGIPDAQVDTRLQETVSHAVELLPALWKESGDYQEAISAYRRALLSQWNLDNDSCARVQKDFAVFLLHSGVEASPPSLGSQVEGSYVPRNNLEEAILLLMILLKKFNQGKAKWDPSVIEHLTFGLSLCSQTSVLAKQLEEVMPGVFSRVERWNSLALCYSAAGQTSAAVNLLRKSLHKHEQPDDLVALLLASKLCSEEPSLAGEGAGYAQRAVNNAQGMDEHLRGVGFRMLGLCLGKQAKVPTSDFERSRLQSESLKALDGAIAFEHNNPDLIFELGVQYAEQRNLKAASRYAKEFIDATGGSVLKGWRFLALVLSAQQRFSEAEVVTDAALDETAKWDQGPLLRLKAKLKISQSNPTEAVETYRYLLALVQAQRKSFGPLRTLSQMEEDKVNEFEVWHGLAYLYSSLSHWNDVEVCLKKAGELKQHFLTNLLTSLCRMWEGRKEFKPALAAFLDGLLLDESSVPCKVAVGALLSERGKEHQPTLPVARSLLSDALRIDPTNRKAWYYLGLVHKYDGRIADATDCFQAASMLEESDPIESFSTIL